MTRCISTCGMTTLNDSDLAIAPDRLSELPRLPRDEGGPVFAEPWQAQAFALAVKLSEQGHYTWKEWAAALSDQLQAAARRGEPDDGSRYYEHWLAALESLVAAKGLADPGALATRKEAWADAYRHTPHGQPVELLHSRAPVFPRGRASVVYLNKPPSSQYRAVGHPIGNTVGEHLVDRAAAALGIDAIEMRRRNVFPDDGYPATTASGVKLKDLSHQRCIDTLVERMRYPELRAEQARLRKQGIHRGIGIACFIKGTAPGPHGYYGMGGAPISLQVT